MNVDDTIIVFDQAYVRLVETWGSEEGIVEAARMSTGKGFLGWGPLPCPKCNGGNPTAEGCDKCRWTGQVPGDEKLLATLWNKKHMSPFEMAGLTFEIQAPIMVFREWHRHRTQSYNEFSARYAELPDMFYVPGQERLQNAKQSTVNKQGSEAGLSELVVTDSLLLIEQAYKACRATYETLLSLGVAREIARLVLPVGQYSKMRASANLRNWFQFLALRTDPAAQWEIRQCAHAVNTFIERQFPRISRLASGQGV